MHIKRFRFGIRVATLFWLAVIAVTAPVSAQFRHPDNAVWLGHAYVTAQSYGDVVVRALLGRSVVRRNTLETLDSPELDGQSGITFGVGEREETYGVVIFAPVFDPPPPLQIL